jgi:hypothetical protein
MLGAGAVLVALAAVGGYLLGKDTAPTDVEASAESRDAAGEAFRTSLQRHSDEARSRGRRAGLIAGRRDASAAGRREGEDDGAGAAEELLAELAPPEPEPGTPGSTVCVAYQDYVPGVGCVPPVAPGETEAPISCPPGQVPVGVTGACGEP